ncbi:MAG: anhydro-N-acetylmuramic acid kinase [Candidatus Hydrogenedentes bacterium]|nr:anhydro-N-acetylmuramic acid kinase [Candidatus Hydrogenedentota bacterium]
MDIVALREKPARFVVGLMSGTSCDGVDAVLVRLKGTGPSLAMKLLKHKTFPYTPAFRTQLLSENLSAKDVCLLSFELGERFAEAARAMMESAGHDGETVDFVASHGHTVGHYPPPGNSRIGTLQIGEPAIIAERTGLPVISDFRARDMAAGGQGAPLVPYADWLLFHKLNKQVLCLNLGGIANYTVVTPKFRNILAFDTGPANMVLDGAMGILTKGDQVYDDGGKAASKGIVIDEFLKYLLEHRYFNKVPPKSTGREEFGTNVYLRDALMARKEHSLEDLMATVTLSVSRSILEAFERFIKPQYEIAQVIVGGGGSKNKTLMKQLQKGFDGVPVYSCDQYGIPSAAREAIAFAILGNETLFSTPANVPQATGAEGQRVLGKITPP